MSASFRSPLTVGRRLLLGFLPSLLAVVLAIALAYYGQLGRRVPTSVVAVGALLAIASLALAWNNARYLGVRISRLAGTMSRSDGSGTSTKSADELDRIEQVMDHLGSALSISEAERRRLDATAAARLREQAMMLQAAVAVAASQLDQMRLPLHILLESRFGELNENQEELLRDARGAGDAMAEELRRLALVAEADRGALPVQQELVQVNDVVRAVLPLVRASAERQGARVDVELEPGLPRVNADRARLAEALTLLSAEAACLTSPDRPFRMSTSREPDGVAVTIAPARVVEEVASEAAGSMSPHPENSARAATIRFPETASEIVATRLIMAQGGSAEHLTDGVRVHLRASRTVLPRSA